MKLVLSKKMNFLKEDQCYFCENGDNLIHMETNSLIIGSVYIDFVQLISEVIQIKVRSVNFALLNP